MMKIWNDFTESLREAWKYTLSRKIGKFTICLLFIFLFSILDASFTLLWIKTGLAVEANPLLNELIHHGDFSFLAIKIILTGVGCLFLYHAKEKSYIAKFVIVLLLCLYCIITAYHFFGALCSIDSELLPDFVSDILVWLS